MIKVTYESKLYKCSVCLLRAFTYWITHILYK